ncbi:MAG: ParA family protein [Flavobacteriales bacterium]
MAKIIAVANQKGGVGKTTTSVNLSAALGVFEKKVLLIDADPQANATSAFGINPEDIDFGTYACLEHTKAVNELVLETNSPNVDLIASSMDLVAAEIELVDKKEREYMLKKALLPIVDCYDYIIIDCAPSLGLITLNALCAAHSVIIPIQCEYFALEGLGKLIDTIKSVRKALNPNLDIEGLLLTMYDSRLRLSNMVIEDVKTHFSSLVFDTVIQRNVRLSEAPSFGENIILYDASSKGAINYMSLSKELILNNEKVT